MPASPDAAVLRLLRESADTYTPASHLGDPRLLDRSLSQLRAAGYEIEHHPHLGYRLLSSPDRLIADDILSRLPTKTAWLRDILVYERTASTNDLITSLARDGAPAGQVIFAEEQTAGRGRLGRQWQSDPRLGLWFSLLLRPRLPLESWPLLTIWLAHALAQGIRRHLGPAAPSMMLKWPNDLYVHGRKLAGILVETSLGSNPFATAGIGLNVNHPTFPPPLDLTATSLRIHGSAPLDRNALAASILDSIDTSYPHTPSHFQPALEWATHSDYLLGRYVSVTAGNTVLDGAAQGIAPDGALLVRTPDSALRRITSGEVTRLSAKPG